MICSIAGKEMAVGEGWQGVRRREALDRGFLGSIILGLYGADLVLGRFFKRLVK